MMMTEEEARTKQCPFVRYCVNQASVIQDKDVPLYEQAQCIASGCMAWRIVPDQMERTTTDLGRMPNGGGWRQIDRGDSYGLRWERLHKNGGGYCAACSAHTSTEKTDG